MPYFTSREVLIYMGKIILSVVAIAIIILFFWSNFDQKSNPESFSSFPIEKKFENPTEKIEKNKEFKSPLSRMSERVTKKRFGTFVSPINSPVSPEKFRGYHTAIDAEVFPEELDKEVQIYAVCAGEIVSKRSASGYGGIIIEKCDLEGTPITVIYGHLKLSSVSAKAGESINAGDVLGFLGEEYSAETGGERKHLHLGFHKGEEIDIRGYVSFPMELQRWIDPCLYVCQD